MRRGHCALGALAALDRHVDLRSLLRLAPAPGRHWFALRAATAIGLPLVVLMAAGHGTAGFLASLGAFAVIYGAGTDVRHRARVIAGVGAGLCASVTLGVLSAGHAWWSLGVMVLVAMVAAWATYALGLARRAPSSSC